MKILAVVCLATAAASVAAQPVQLQRGAAGELRAIYVTPVEIADGERVAKSACARCHGADGISKTKGVPHLAGQRAAYLDQQLQAYRAGSRPKSAMTGAVRDLSEDALVNVAAYYASLEPPRPAAARGKATAGADPLQAAKDAAGACAGCHGDQGVSSTAATPSLAGQEAGYFVAALQAYKSGARKDDVMSGLAASLDDKAMRNLAAYYAGLTPQAPNVRRPLSLEQWTERCDRCHGPAGNSLEPLIPRLAAQRADWLEEVLQEYRGGARRSSAMAAMSAMLGEHEMKELAAYYARQPARSVVYVVVPPAGAGRSK
jgi:cytochrome c553